MRIKVSGGLLALASMLAFTTTGCGAGGGSSDSSSVTAANVFGMVTQSTTISSVVTPGKYKASNFFKAGGHKKTNSAQTAGAVANCTVTAYDMLTNAVIGSATSGTDGTYTITGVESGTTYKIVADCGASEKYTIVAKADKTSTADKDPAVTSPVSTIVAAKVISAVLAAVEAAAGTSGIPANTLAAIKLAVLGAMDSVIVNITATIENAIQSGAMDPPDITEAAAIAGGLATATTSANADTASNAYEIAKPPPPAVGQAVDGAKSQAGALADCDSTIPAKDEATCSRAIAQILYSGLNFSVGFKISSGIFATELAASGGCADTNTSITAIFKNATFDVPVGDVCIIKPIFGKVDRNRGDERGGDDGGMVFVEDDVVSGKKGLISSLGNALFHKYKYNMTNMDSIVFTYNAMTAGNESGLNARPFYIAQSNGSAGSTSFPTVKYKAASGTWTAIPSTQYTDSMSWCSSSMNPCDVVPNANSGDHLQFPFKGTATGWSPTDLSSTLTLGTASLGTLVTAIGAGSASGSFMKMYGGPLPSLAQLDQVFETRTHLNNNPTGHSKIWAIYSEKTQDPGGSTTNPCNDLSSSSPCLGVSSTAYPALKVTPTIATTPAAAGSPIRAITNLTAGSTGTHVLRPYYGINGFTGVMGLTKIADGHEALNEINQERGLKVIMDSGECSGHNLHATCGVGDVFNITLDWSNCTGGDHCPNWQGLGASVPKVIGLSLATSMETNIRQAPVFIGVIQFWVVSQGDWGMMTPVEVGITPGSGTDAISTGSTYYIVPHMNCTGTNCSADFYYLVDKNTGAVRTSTDDGDAVAGDISSGTVCGVVASAFACNVTNAIKYTLTDIDNNYPIFGLSSSDTLSSIAGNTFVYNGPVMNPSFKCSGQPFFLDGNSNGKLDCNAGDTAVVGASNDISFADQWEYQNWYNNPNISGTLKARALIPRENGFSYGDPVGAKKLITTAFNGWFDGTHSIDSTTKVDALQAFGLIYVMFEQRGGTHMDTNGEPGISQANGGGDPHFLVQMPADGAGADSALTINHLFANGFTNFKQP